MTTRKTAVIVMAAGLGTRMRSARPKVMHPVAGLPMIGHVMRAARAVNPAEIVVVVGPGMDDLVRAVAPARIAVQEQRLGTAHAVMASRDRLGRFAGDILILNGDAPMLQAATLRRLLRARRSGAELVLMAMRMADPAGYGRLVLDARGRVERIVEHRDADAALRAIDLCYAGIMAVDGSRLWPLLDRIKPDNAKGEFYLTDLVALARGDGLTCRHVEVGPEEALGVNSRVELAAAEAAMQARLRAAAMLAGATLTDPSSVFLHHDTRLGRDVTIGPGVVFGPGVRVEDNAEIRAFCHVEGARIGKGAIIGPFARVRPGSRIGAGAHVGNFVEVKNARVAPGAKMNHLSYIGDASVGAKANIGAGTITCNYDGFVKARTTIGAGAFIGSNSALVAPVRIGARAIVGAGSVITRDVGADALAVARGKQATRPGWAAAFRERQRKHSKKG